MNSNFITTEDFKTVLSVSFGNEHFNYSLMDMELENSKTTIVTTISESPDDKIYIFIYGLVIFMGLLILFSVIRVIFFWIIGDNDPNNTRNNSSNRSAIEVSDTEGARDSGTGVNAARNPSTAVDIHRPSFGKASNPGSSPSRVKKSSLSNKDVKPLSSAIALSSSSNLNSTISTCNVDTSMLSPSSADISMPYFFYVDNSMNTLSSVDTSMLSPSYGGRSTSSLYSQNHTTYLNALKRLHCGNSDVENVNTYKIHRISFERAKFEDSEIETSFESIPRNIRIALSMPNVSTRVPVNNISKPSISKITAPIASYAVSILDLSYDADKSATSLYSAESSLQSLSNAKDVPTSINEKCLQSFTVADLNVSEKHNNAIRITNTFENKCSTIEDPRLKNKPVNEVITTDNTQMNSSTCSNDIFLPLKIIPKLLTSVKSTKSSSSVDATKFYCIVSKRNASPPGKNISTIPFSSLDDSKDLSNSNSEKCLRQYLSDPDISKGSRSDYSGIAFNSKISKDIAEVTTERQSPTHSKTSGDLKMPGNALSEFPSCEPYRDLSRVPKASSIETAWKTPLSRESNAWETPLALQRKQTSWLTPESS